MSFYELFDCLDETLLFTLVGAYVFVLLILLCVAESVYPHSTKPISEKSDRIWVKRTCEAAPNCALIHAELLTSDGRTRMLWKVDPAEVDFSHPAAEPVISYFIVEV